MAKSYKVNHATNNKHMTMTFNLTKYKTMILPNIKPSHFTVCQVSFMCIFTCRFKSKVMTKIKLNVTYTQDKSLNYSEPPPPLPDYQSGGLKDILFQLHQLLKLPQTQLQSISQVSLYPQHKPHLYLCCMTC